VIEACHLKAEMSPQIPAATALFHVLALTMIGAGSVMCLREMPKKKLVQSLERN